jgi:hypothetical protein
MALPNLQKLYSPKKLFLRLKDMLSSWTFRKLQSLVVKDLMGRFWALDKKEHVGIEALAKR